MDLKDLDLTAAADQGAWLTPVHPRTGEDLPIKIHLASADSTRWIEEEARDKDKRLKAMAKVGKMPDLTTAEIEERGIRLLAAVTLGWENVEWEGAPCPFNQQNARVLYRTLRWLRDQVDAFVSDRANFGEVGKAPAASAFSPEAITTSIVENFTSGQSGNSATAPVNGE